MNKTQIEELFDWSLYQRNLVINFAQIPQLEKLKSVKEKGDKPVVLHSLFRLEALRKKFPEISDEVIFSTLEKLAKEGRIKVFLISADKECYANDLVIGIELGWATKTVRTFVDHDEMRLNETFQNLRLYKGDPLTSSELAQPEAILNVKEAMGNEIKAGLERVASRRPALYGMVELELKRKEQERKDRLEQELLELIESKKKR